MTCLSERGRLFSMTPRRVLSRSNSSEGVRYQTLSSDLVIFQFSSVVMLERILEFFVAMYDCPCRKYPETSSASGRVNITFFLRPNSYNHIYGYITISTRMLFFAPFSDYKNIIRVFFLVFSRSIPVGPSMPQPTCSRSS